MLRCGLVFVGSAQLCAAKGPHRLAALGLSVVRSAPCGNSSCAGPQTHVALPCLPVCGVLSFGGGCAGVSQDLPNYVQQQVPIFSLPQEWLWCESWCGNATKYKARTIDLCNNPMTKEPKLIVSHPLLRCSSHVGMILSCALHCSALKAPPRIVKYKAHHGPGQPPHDQGTQPQGTPGSYPNGRRAPTYSTGLIMSYGIDSG